MEKTNSSPETALGSYLRTERERLHVTIEQVASATKINIKLLHALESDNFDELPAKPFVRGFVTSYTRYLGLDPSEILSRYEVYLDEKSGQKFKRSPESPHIFVESEKQRENSKTALSIVMGSFLVIAAIVFAVIKPALKHRRHKKETTQQAKTEKSSSQKVSNSEVVTVLPPNAPKTAQEKAAPKAPQKTQSQNDTANVALATQTGSQEKPDQTPIDKVAQKTEPAAQPDSQKITETAPPVSKPEKIAEVAQTSKPELNSPSAETKPSASIVAVKKDKEALEQTLAAANAEKEEEKPKPPVNLKWPKIPPEEVKQLLVVRALQDSWIKYQADDFPIKQYTLKEGQKIYIRGRESVRFHSYKQDGVEISTDNVNFHLQQPETVIIPESAKVRYQTDPFVDPNPKYLSTSNP